MSAARERTWNAVSRWAGWLTRKPSMKDVAAVDAAIDAEIAEAVKEINEVDEETAVAISTMAAQIASRDARIAESVAAAPVPALSRTQPCGCLVCVCEGDRCNGCGACWCGTHPRDKIPNPVYEPHPLAARDARIAELEGALRTAVGFVDSCRLLAIQWHAHATEKACDRALPELRAVLAKGTT